MSNTGLDVFDRTIQLTNIWLKEINEDLGPDKQFAWHVLGTVARCLRDQLQPDMAVHLGAQLPLLVRGTYYEGWHTPGEPDPAHNAEAFLAKAAEGLAMTRSVGTEDAVRAVFGVISRHVDREQVTKVRGTLPEPIRRLWPEELLTEGPR
jgi:uncharacterized protein (DUF2267 family)